MGFALTGEDQFTRNLWNAGDVGRTHRYFARHLEDMLLQSAHLRLCVGRVILGLFPRRVDGKPFRYGSGVWRFVGFDIQPGDLDFWVSDTQFAAGSAKNRRAIQVRFR